MKKRFGLSIIGGSGYGAGELIRLLLQHPEIEVCGVTSRSHVGAPITTIHSHLTGLTSLKFEARPCLATLGSYQRGAIVLAMPSGMAVSTVQELLGQELPQNVSIIDLSGDLRLKDEDQHNKFYPEVPFASDVRARFRYGLPEIHALSEQDRFITNPGCLATAAILALAPLREFKLERAIVVDAKTGTSGAGREPQPSMHHPSRCSDFTAYKVLAHRHEPEILQALGDKFSTQHSLMFVPHLIPASRGIFITAYATLTTQSNTAEITNHFTEFYRDSPFIRLRATPPRLVDVVGTNFCDISIGVRGNQICVMSCIDNLVKGMAGQAIQNLNYIFGLAGDCGLRLAAIGPV